MTEQQQRIIAKVCECHPDVDPDMVKLIIISGCRAIKASLRHSNKSDKRALLISGLGTFYISTEASQERGRKAFRKLYKRHWKKYATKKRNIIPNEISKLL